VQQQFIRFGACGDGCASVVDFVPFVAAGIEVVG
jgi:hypothetical protein